MEGDLSEFNLSKRVKTRLKNKPFLKRLLASGKSAQQILEFDEETMQKFCNAAYKLLDHKSYEDAVDAFLFLVALNPYQHDYWLGLGMANQFCHHFEEAIDAYEMAAICKIDNPLPYLYLAKCLFSIHDRKSALEALELAIEYAGESEAYAQVKEQAEQAKQILLQL